MKIGIDLGGTKIEIVVLTQSGEECYKKRVATPDNYQDMLQAVTNLVLEAERELDITATVGMGIPGTISSATGLVKNANMLWLNGHPLDTDLSKLLDREVRVSNDANCMVVSEAVDGAGKGHSVVLGIIIGTGAGSGICIDGKPLGGRHGICGEWGHVPLPWQTEEDKKAIAQLEPCQCQTVGCIEQFVSGTGLCNDYARKTGDKINGAQIVQKAQAGDAVATQTLEIFEDRLARSIGLYINMLDPDVIVIAGGACNIESIYTSLPKLMQPYAFGGEFTTPIVKAMHGDSSGGRGAAYLWGK